MAIRWRFAAPINDSRADRPNSYTVRDSWSNLRLL